MAYTVTPVDYCWTCGRWLPLCPLKMCAACHDRWRGGRGHARARRP